MHYILIFISSLGQTDTKRKNRQEQARKKAALPSASQQVSANSASQTVLLQTTLPCDSCPMPWPQSTQEGQSNLQEVTKPAHLLTQLLSETTHEATPAISKATGTFILLRGFQMEPLSGSQGASPWPHPVQSPFGQTCSVAS